jgi:hypothetical protein
MIDTHAHADRPNGTAWQPVPALGAGGAVPARESRRAVPSPRPPLASGQLDAQLLQAVRQAAWMRKIFYVVVLLVALTGQVTGAVQKLDIPAIVAIPAVAALELGGIVVMTNADVRRRLGERALASRILSAGIAAGAVAFNWLAHSNHLLGGFFAGMSALGYLVWLMGAENQRRDRLRASGDLPPTTPAYELVGHWLRHPLLTRQARAMAKADPSLGLYDSLAAARRELRRERRDAAIAKVLNQKIRAAVDPTTATIAVHVYDLGEIAARLADTADYDGLTALIAADLTPMRIAAGSGDQGRAGRWRRRGGPQPSDRSALARMNGQATTLERSTDPGVDVQGDTGQQGVVPPRNSDELTSRTHPPEPCDPSSDGAAATETQQKAHRTPPHPADLTAAKGRGGGLDDRADKEQRAAHPDPGVSEDADVPQETAGAVAYWLGIDPHMNFAEIAAKIGRTERTVRRNLPPGFERPPPRSRG